MFEFEPLAYLDSCTSVIRHTLYILREIMYACKLCRSYEPHTKLLRDISQYSKGVLLPSKMHGICCSVQASRQRSCAGSIICCQKCVANGCSLWMVYKPKSCKLQLTLVWSLKGQHFKSLVRLAVLEKSCICPGSANTSTFMLKQLAWSLWNPVWPRSLFCVANISTHALARRYALQHYTSKKHNGIKFNFYLGLPHYTRYKLDIVIFMFMSHQDI